MVGAPIQVKVIPTILVGAAGGLLVGLTSVGSGSLIIICLHVREHGRYEGADVVLGPGAAAEDIVEAVQGAFAAAGIETRTEIRRVSPGDTPELIVGVAADVDADLIVMGTRGMTEWKSLLLGGVANKVIHHATCPVLLVR
jgi:nucleotide-binding universal stress UspA family protein